MAVNPLPTNCRRATTSPTRHDAALVASQGQGQGHLPHSYGHSQRGPSPPTVATSVPALPRIAAGPGAAGPGGEGAAAGRQAVSAGGALRASWPVPGAPRMPTVPAAAAGSAGAGPGAAQQQAVHAHAHPAAHHPMPTPQQVSLAEQYVGNVMRMLGAGEAKSGPMVLLQQQAAAAAAAAAASPGAQAQPLQGAAGGGKGGLPLVSSAFMRAALAAVGPARAAGGGAGAAGGTGAALVPTGTTGLHARAMAPAVGAGAAGPLSPGRPPKPRSTLQ